MEYRTLGRTGLRVSLMSFGTGGPSSLGKSGGLDQKQQDDLIRRCLDLGINLFDTSERYGASEEILGRGLRDVPRDSYFLATKWGYDADGQVNEDPEALSRSVEGSLSRLNADCIDIMQIHGIRLVHYNQVVERFYPVLERLRDQGKIRFIGFSERFSEDPAHEAAVMALKSHPDMWDTIMLKYGILNQYADKEALPLAQQHGVGILNMAAVRVKLPRPAMLEELIGEWKQRGDVPPEALPDKDPLGWLIHDGVDSVISAGYKFAADHPAISTVLTGTTNIEHLESNARALEPARLPQEDKQRLMDLFGHIAEYA